MTEITNIELLTRLHTIATAFAVAVAAEREAAVLPPLTGVVIVVFDVGDPPTLALEVSGVRIATMPMDVAAGPLVAEIVSRGLARMTPIAKALAGPMLETGRTALVLLVPMGQDRISTHGVIVDRALAAAPVEVFALTADAREETVN